MIVIKSQSQLYGNISKKWGWTWFLMKKGLMWHSKMALNSLLTLGAILTHSGSSFIPSLSACWPPAGEFLSSPGWPGFARKTLHTWAVVLALEPPKPLSWGWQRAHYNSSLRWPTLALTHSKWTLCPMMPAIYKILRMGYNDEEIAIREFMSP